MQKMRPTPFILLIIVSLFNVSNELLPPLFTLAIPLASNRTLHGINYGMVADNLPPPHIAMHLIKSLGISQVKIYTTNASTLQAFANSGISFIVGVGNEDLHALTNPQNALAWVQTHIVPYIATTPISAIAVGNEVLTTNDPQLNQDLLPAILSLHAALASLPPSTPSISISTPHSLGILSSSYPPSGARFNPSIADSSLHPLALFLSQTGSPFMINAYPYFAYKDNPTTISLPYTLFQSSDGVQDINTGLRYYNMLDAQVDAIYSALGALGFGDIKVIVTETGWPSEGDANEPGANKKNARSYTLNIMKRLTTQKGTPLKPNIPLKAYLFALFNEDSKPGPLSERHYGLFNPNGTQVYDLGLSVANSQVSAHNNNGRPTIAIFSSSSPGLLPLPSTLVLRTSILGLIMLLKSC
ncbi:hypothetical protein L7F22_021835 [Adiantum nelumboides]|nr:hypothetical protein [Adiantum nelumboides]